MGENSKIEWTGKTQNWWWGCKRVSPGCLHCYIESIMKRGGHDPWTVKRTSAANWRKPMIWNRKAEAAGRREFVFACSMTDFFIAEADGWRAEAWDIMRECEWLDWQVLTKRVA